MKRQRQSSLAESLDRCRRCGDPAFIPECDSDVVHRADSLRFDIANGDMQFARKENQYGQRILGYAMSIVV